MLRRNRSDVSISALDSETPSSTPASPGRSFVLHGSMRSMNQSSFKSTSSLKWGAEKPESPTGSMNSPFRDALRSGES